MIHEIWSCNPADIPEWTVEAKERLVAALGEIFGWKPKMKTVKERKAYQSKYAGKYFQHQDGGIYKFQFFARSSEDSDQYAVVYLHIWPFEYDVWIRPIEQWTEDRFKCISEETALSLMCGKDRIAHQAEITAARTARKSTKPTAEKFNGESSI